MVPNSGFNRDSNVDSAEEGTWGLQKNHGAIHIRTKTNTVRAIQRFQAALTYRVIALGRLLILPVGRSLQALQEYDEHDSWLSARIK